MADAPDQNDADGADTMADAPDQNDADGADTTADAPDRDDASFETFDPDDRRRWLSRREAGSLLALALLGVLYLYDLLVLDGNDGLVEPWGPIQFRWDVSRLDWLFVLALLVFFLQVVVPLAVDRRRTAQYYKRLRRDVPATLALVYLVVLVVVGIAGPVVVGQPTLDVTASYQPPVFTTGDVNVTSGCLGNVTGYRCHGTMKYPLGTTFGGEGVLAYTIAGSRLALQVALITAMLIVPLGTVVGTTAAYLGDRVDAALMRVTDVVQTVPPFFAYIVVRFVQGGGGDVVTMLLIFGLLSWGKVARLVRSEALSVREEAYVTAARDAGGGWLYVVRRHLFPNVSSTAIPATTQQMSWLVLVEAALSYLELGAPSVVSWGTIIADGTKGSAFGELLQTWWISLIPVVVLATTVIAINVLGDALRDVLDPRLW